MIPIYRAKKIDGDEWVEGYLLPSLKRYDNKSFIVNDFTRFQGLTTDREVDPNTLAIHFPNVIDKNGKKIFASLSEDGIGGDIVNIHTSISKGKAVLYFDDESFSTRFLELFGNRFTWECNIDSIENKEVIGIHKGE